MDGLDVFTDEGLHVGLLEDLSVDPETGKILGIVIKNVDGKFLRAMEIETTKGVIIPFSGIKAINDIIVVKNVAYSLKEAS
jgi:sporulation protein YlmC with PRC-barrel domain|tara:strand:+ start:2981 stop:3223 length:243 start_codon:yes stop_codon:yes gene_type:complete